MASRFLPQTTPRVPPEPFIPERSVMVWVQSKIWQVRKMRSMEKGVSHSSWRVRVEMPVSGLSVTHARAHAYSPPPPTDHMSTQVWTGILCFSRSHDPF